MDFLSKILDAINSNHASIAVVLGVLFSIAKAVSNEKAGPVVSKIQGAFDLAAKGLALVGQICASVASFLADLVKSDGVLGSK